MHTDQLTFTNLPFRPSTMKEGKFTSKVKTWRDEPGGGKTYTGDLIVIAEKGSGVKAKGRYDVKVKPMQKGKGYIVVDAKLYHDKFSIIREGFRVIVTVNDKQDRLIREDGSTVPLSFSPKKYYDPVKICDNIKAKCGYLQIDPKWDMEAFFTKFIADCEVAYKEYEAWRINENSSGKVDTDKLKDLYGRK